MYGVLRLRAAAPVPVMRSFWGSVLVAAVLCVGIGCAEESSPPAPSPESLAPPVGPESGQPRLQTGPTGAVWLSWVDPLEDGRHALRYATLEDTTWSDPETVAAGADWFVNWADLPSVRPLPDGRVAAHYLESNGPSTLAYAVRVVQGAGDGVWRPPVTPHDDGTPTEHGFVSLLPWNDGVLSVWLDGRRMSGDGHGHGEMTLRAAVIDSTGAVEQGTVLDARTCECCATDAVRADGEALVAYRDRSADEVRDIALTRYDGTQWSDPTRLHADGWQIEGCPVNGPALAARGKQVAVAWFTAAGGKPRVKAALSEDGGRHFADPVVVADGPTEGRVDVALLDDGTAAVSWLEQHDDRGRVRARAVSADRTTAPPTTIAAVPSTARGVGFPKIVRDRDRLYAAWVGPDSTETMSVQMARLPVTAVRAGP